MSDKKDQTSKSPSQNLAFRPLKKRIMADKSLVWDGSDDGDVANKDTLQELQIKAFYAVLQALTLENSTMTNKRYHLIDKLVNELEIAEETHITIADNIQNKLLTLQQMEDSSHYLKATPSSTIVPTSGKNWGSVNPESLIGKWVCFRMSGDDEFEEYIINAYDAKQEMHRLVSPDLDPMEADDQYSCFVDLREVEDIMWEGGEKPNFNAPNTNLQLQQLLEPFVTLPKPTHILNESLNGLAGVSMQGQMRS